MLKKSLQLLIISTLGIFFLTACAQKNIELPSNYWKQKKHTLAVIRSKEPTPGFYCEGNKNLLDFAIIKAMNWKLDKNLSHSDLSWYSNLPKKLSTKFNQKHIDSTSTSDIFDHTLYKKNMNLYAKKIGGDELLKIKLEAYGVRREYWGAVPLTQPQAYCLLSGELIDTKTNNVLWRHKALIRENIIGEWDQPPAYPNIAVALNVAAEKAQAELLNSLFETNKA